MLCITTRSIPVDATWRWHPWMISHDDDARDFISVVWGQFFIIATMLGVGLVWAFIRGWQLMLAGLAIAPVFAITMAVQTKLVAKCEVRNKRACEDVAKDYYDVHFVFVLTCNSRHSFDDHTPRLSSMFVASGLWLLTVSSRPGLMFPSIIFDNRHLRRFCWRMHTWHSQWSYLPGWGAPFLCQSPSYCSWPLQLSSDDRGSQSRGVLSNHWIPAHGFQEVS